MSAALRSFSFFFCPVIRAQTQPATVARKNGSSVKTRTRSVHVFARHGADCYAQSVISSKNFCIVAQAQVCKDCRVAGWAQAFARKV